MKPCKITIDLYNTFRERMPEYVQYDRNVPLEITVLENGKPADLNGLFGRLLVSKPDGHEVYSNDVEINGNVITTILGEQVFTASGVAQVTVDILDEQNSKRALIPFGMRIRSAVITDESIKSSNDYQTITALISDVRALNAMFHVEQEQRAEAFNTQMQSQEATFTEAQRQFLEDHREAMFHVEQQTAEQADMFHVEQTKRAKAFEQSEADREQRFETQTTEWAQTVEQAEAIRQFNEERRQSAESKRESAEKARESAERQRVDTEAVRQRQEQERGQGEAGRATAEANRVKAEQTRVDNESSRKSAESNRVNAESQRTTAESHRATAETSRVNAESQRATAETNRAGAEGRRSEAESSRVTAESGRVTAESQRVTAENTREAQENARREAEEDRATRMAQWEAKAEETAQKAQEAVDSAQAFVNTNEERLLTDRDKIDYWGNHHANMKDMTDATVDKILGDFNTLNHTGEYITATETIARHVPRGTLKGHTEVNCIQEPSNQDIVLPYAFENGQHVTINDTKESGALGVELKGQTLVNLWKKHSTHNISNFILYDDGFMETKPNVRYFDHIQKAHTNMIKPNTKYLLIIEVEKNTLPVAITYQPDARTFFNSATNQPSVLFEPKQIGRATKILTSISDLSSTQEDLRWGAYIQFAQANYASEEQGIVKIRQMLIEYQEGMENWDIDYFEGMQSVKSPVLTTTGKNLATVSNVRLEGIRSNSGGHPKNIIMKNIPVEEGKTYTISGVGSKSDNMSYISLTRYEHRNPTDSNNHSQLWNEIGRDNSNTTFTIPKGIKYVSFTFGNCVYNNNGEDGWLQWDSIQLEEGSVATTHEPHKSSILSLPEEVVLRKIHNVYETIEDTLSCSTGIMKSYVNELTLNGSEDWNLYRDRESNTIAFMFHAPYGRMHQIGVMSCDKVPVYTQNEALKLEDKEWCFYNDHGSPIVFINVLRSKLTSPDVAGFKTWLRENNMKIQYPSETPVTTKINLPSTLKSWNTSTHINTSVPENSLKPIIAPVNPSYEVMLKPSTQYSIITNPIANGHASTPIEFNLGGSIVETVIGNGCTLITTPSTLANNKLEMSGRGQKLQGGVMVFEGNKTGMIFSHFDGMKSVENPTVRVNNENLWRGEAEYNIIPEQEYFGENWITLLDEPIFINGDVNFSCKFKGSNIVQQPDVPPLHASIRFMGYCKDGQPLDRYQVMTNSVNDDSVVNIELKKSLLNIKVITKVILLATRFKGSVNLSEFCITKSECPNSFIPAQSNSLPLAIPMRSLPNGVCDTLNLLTGEYVQRIKEKTLDGTEGWTQYDLNDEYPDVIGFYHSYRDSRNVLGTNVQHYFGIIPLHTQDPLPGRLSSNEEWFGIHDGKYAKIALLKSRLSTIDTNGLKQWLSENPVVVQYELATHIVTQLDLQWEDGKLFAYDGTTHFFVDVEGGQLMPILDIDVPVNLAQRTSRLCAEKEQLETEKAQLANEVSVLQLRNAVLQGEVATLEQSNKDLQKGQEKLDKDSQELAHAVTIIDEHREEGDLELLSSDFDFELRLMEIEFAVGIPMMANYKGVRSMARTPYDMAKALILGGKYEREEMVAKLDRFEKLGSITADQKAELVALMDAVELTQ